MRLNSDGNFQLQGINLAVHLRSLHTVETALLWANPLFIYRELCKTAAVFLYGLFYKIFLPAAVGLSCRSDAPQMSKASEIWALASMWLRGWQCQIHTELGHLLGPVQGTVIYQSWKAQGCSYRSDTSLLLQDLQDHTARTVCEALGPGTPGCQSPTPWPTCLKDARLVVTAGSEGINPWWVHLQDQHRSIGHISTGGPAAAHVLLGSATT